MDIITLALAKKYARDLVSGLPRGITYKGAVNYYSQLPSNASIGDCYIVRYKGTSGNEPDGTEYIWGNYEGTAQWIAIGGNSSDGTWGSITGTLADQTDLQAALDSKLDKSGGAITGKVILNDVNAQISVKDTVTGTTYNVLSGAVSNNSSGMMTIGSPALEPNIFGSSDRPYYSKNAVVFEELAFVSDVSGKADRPTIATELPESDDTLAVNTQYYLGIKSAVNIVLPSNASPGDQIMVAWYNGATAALLSVPNTVIGARYTPTANSRSKVVFEWDGTNWVFSHDEINLN